MVAARSVLFKFFHLYPIRHSIPFFLLLLTGVSACAPASAPPDLTPVSVQLSWLHQAQFAGLYAAEQQGYYADEGLDVSFVEGGPEVDFISPVADGRAQFGMAQPADLILARAAGKPVRAITVIFQRSPVVFIALADSGISRPKDFAGKKIRTAVTLDQTLRALMARQGIRPDQYETVYLPSDVEQFAAGDIPVWGGFVNVFVLEVQRAGHEIKIISPDDYGLHFYGDVLITTDELIRDRPDLVRGFLRATLKGWAYALENPDQVGGMVQDYKPDANADLETDKMIASIPLVNPGETSIGWMSPEAWKTMTQTLRDQGALKGPLDLEDVYTTQFLEEIYSK